ncbi:MAG: YjjG family noncanonical pyrimidine nucleotidase [Paludibacteraceae bacterium]|nr:YjjG family noncanonical pyrimidine nucleotidase [Paludibacteraceae bacterium]
MNKQYTDLFIDFDDTLYDTRGSAQRALKELYAVCRLDEHFEDANIFFNAYWQTNVQLWSDYAKGLITRDYLIVERFKRPLNQGNFESISDEMCLAMSDKFLELCTSFTVIVEGAHDLLQYLTQRGYRLHMCSNGFHEVQFKKLNNADMAKYFTTVILSEDTGANKPSKQFFDFALKQSRADKEHTIMIGDNFDTDMLGALNAGIDTLLFNRWDKSFVPPKKVDFIVNSLAEIKTIL